ncbi:outer membrane protein [Xanthobacter sp. TB0139]|uniref:outer membrane protein n=1 Tax=Xanthobacter sp. TB0139 TaxID=3459178 RepID=UPI004039D0A8
MSETTLGCVMWRKNGLKVSLLAASMVCSLSSPLLAEDEFARLLGEDDGFSLPPPSLDDKDEEQPVLLGQEGDFTLPPPKLDMEEASPATPGKWYLRASAGFVAPQADSLKVNGADVARGASASGWSVGGAIGYRLTDWLRAEASVDYLDLGNSGAPWAPAGRHHTDATVFLGNIYWDIITIANFTPYVGGGIGVATTTLESPPWQAMGGQKTHFAWSLAGGVSYAVNSQWAVDFGYRYISLGSPSFGDPAFTAMRHSLWPATNIGRPASIDTLGAHEVRIALRYQFGD